MFQIWKRSGWELPGQNVTQNFDNLLRFLRHGERCTVDLFQGVTMLGRVQHDQ
jgi:hypothetical protein